jgi:hypothetical protein
LWRGNQVVGTLLDLAWDAKRLLEVVRGGVVADLGERAFVGTDAGGEVAKAIGAKRGVGSQGFPESLALSQVWVTASPSGLP